MFPRPPTSIQWAPSTRSRTEGEEQSRAKWAQSTFINSETATTASGGRSGGLSAAKCDNYTLSPPLPSQQHHQLYETVACSIVSLHAAKNCPLTPNSHYTAHRIQSSGEGEASDLWPCLQLHSLPVPMKSNLRLRFTANHWPRKLLHPPQAVGCFLFTPVTQVN